MAGRTVVTVAGETDHETGGRLGDDLRAAVLSGARRVEVDFSRVGFCDCAGLNVLLAARIHCQDPGVGFSVRVIALGLVIRPGRCVRPGPAGPCREA
jgi:anti-anti-sigma regulatory factor